MKKIWVGILCLLSAIAASAVTVTTFTGTTNLDLSGTYVYAVNMGGTWNQAPVVFQGQTFIDSRVAVSSNYLTITNTGTFNSTPYGGTQPNYGDGSTLKDLTYGNVMAYGAGASVGLSMNVTTGKQYELKMLFSENTYKTANARTFDISVEGVKIVDEFTPIPAGAEWTTAPLKGVCVTYQFTAGDSVLNIDLTQGATGDVNPLINAFALKDLNPPPANPLVTTFTNGNNAVGGLSALYSGSFTNAVNLGGHWNNQAVTIGNASFSPSNGTVTVTGTGAGFGSTKYLGTGPVYAGDTTSLGTITASGYQTWGAGPSISLTAPVTSNNQYTVYLLFSENAYTSTATAVRNFDINVEGIKIIDDFRPFPVGADWKGVGQPAKPHKGVMVAYTFTAGDNTLNIDLTAGTGADPNPQIMGFALKNLTVPPPPPPPPPTPYIWENDMSANPVGNGWVVRGAGNNYTMSGGLLTMNAAAWGTILDTTPTNNLVGVTVVDLKWRVTTPNALGAGIWVNAAHDTATYGSLRFDSTLSNNIQTVSIPASTPVLLTGFGTGMLTLHAVINADSNTIAYVVTDNVITNSGTVSFTRITSAGAPLGSTLFTEGSGAEVDYVRVQAGFGGTVVLTASAGGGGTITPTNVTVSVGGSTNFVITAANYYRILSLTTNGTAVAGVTFTNESTSYNFTWSNVQSTGLVQAAFTPQVVPASSNCPIEVPYAWLAINGITSDQAAAVLLDQDVDGMSTWQEYIAGTGPTDAEDVLKASQTTRNVITWIPVFGRIYSVYWSTNLMQGFTALDANIPYPQNSYTNSTPDGKVNHYQVKVRLP